MCSMSTASTRSLRTSSSTTSHGRDALPVGTGYAASLRRRRRDSIQALKIALDSEAQRLVIVKRELADDTVSNRMHQNAQLMLLIVRALPIDQVERALLGEPRPFLASQLPPDPSRRLPLGWALPKALDWVIRRRILRAHARVRDPLLGIFLRHPLGSEVIVAFSDGVEAGRARALSQVNEAEEALRGLDGLLGIDPNIIWRFPPAVAAGAHLLGLTTVPSFIDYALDWAETHGRSDFERALEVAASAVMLVQLLGGPIGEAIGEVLDVVLAAAETGVAFLRDLEQADARAATMFAPPEARLGSDQGYRATAIAAAAAIVSALSAVVPAALAVRRARKRAARSAEDIVPELPAAGGTNRGLPTRPASDPAAAGLDNRAVDRLADARPTQIARGTAGRTTAREFHPLAAGEPTAPGSPSARPPSRPVGTSDSSFDRDSLQRQFRQVTVQPRRSRWDPPAVSGVAGVPPANVTGGASRLTAGTGGIVEIHRSITPHNTRGSEVAGWVLTQTQTPRRGFEYAWPKGSQLGVPLPDYHVCHLWPSRWGDEAEEGLAYANARVYNLSWGWRIEAQLEDMAQRARLQGGRVWVHARAETFERSLQGGAWGDVLHQVRYEVSFVDKNGASIPFGRAELTLLPPDQGGGVESAEFYR